MNAVHDFIKSVVGEKDGFVLDEAWSISEDSFGVIVPIIRNTKLGREYITFAEAEDVEVKDTGDINYVYVKNNEDSPLLISRGELFAGKTQERAAVHGHIIMPDKGMRVAVRCIHATKGIRQGEYMHYGGRAPYTVAYNLSRGQQKTWESVKLYSSSSRCAAANYSSTANKGAVTRNTKSTAQSFSDDNGMVGPLGANIGANRQDDLVGTLSGVSAMMKEAFRKIPDIENQVGAIFVQRNSVLGLDVYDITDSWSAVKQEVIEKEGSEFLSKDETDLFTLDTSRINKFLSKRLGKRTFKEEVIYGKEQGKPYQVVGIEEVTDEPNGLMGEAVIFNDRVIHLTMYRS